MKILTLLCILASIVIFMVAGISFISVHENKGKLVDCFDEDWNKIMGLTCENNSSYEGPIVISVIGALMFIFSITIIKDMEDALIRFDE